MALTNALAIHTGKQPSAPLIALEIEATLDATYPNGGYAFDPSALLRSLGNYDKLPTVTHVNVESKDGYAGEYDRVNEKLKIFKGGGLGNATLSSAGLAIGSGSKAKIKIVNTINFTIDGVLYQKTTAEVAFTATTHDITADALLAQEAKYLLTMDAAGTVTLTKGTTAGAGLSVIPATPAGAVVALGYVLISIAAGVTDFDASSDLLDAGHITDTYVNLAFNPVETLAAQEVPTGTDIAAVLTSLRVLILAQ